MLLQIHIMLGETGFSFPVPSLVSLHSVSGRVCFNQSIDKGINQLSSYIDVKGTCLP